MCQALLQEWENREMAVMGLPFLCVCERDTEREKLNH